jgi:iron complex transport system substrate-binding protein
MKSTYKQLSDIAPTVLLRWGDDWNSSFKTYLRGIAQIVDREEVAEEILMQYQNRVAEVKKQLGNRLKNIEISAIIYGHGGRREFLAPPRYAIWFQILDDLGIKIKPIFSTQGNWSSYFSTELISDYDSDVLFILNSFSQSGAFLLENPLLASLNAVKNKRTYVMDGQDVFDVYGPSGVNKLLDLLAEKLLKVAQTL